MTLQQLIFATVAYADVFDYPLKETELHRWMIGSTRIRIPRVVHGTERSIHSGKTYLILTGRKHLVPLRVVRGAIASKKWSLIRHIATKFMWIPTVLLVGVTGGLSVDNARTEDDIDLFFVTGRGTVWATRFLVTATADLLGLRRRPHERVVKNKICLNMFMAEDSLSLPKRDRDLFSAHEVLQMTPLWDRGGVYRKFLSVNRWVKYFLPNAWKENATGKQKIVKSQTFTILFTLFEPLARTLQLLYMKKHRTTEIIGDGVLRFHPKDARVWVKKKYAKRLKKYNIPLDNVFYHR